MRVIGVNRQCLLKARQRLDFAFEALQCIASFDKRVYIVGPYCERLIVLRDGVFITPQCRKQVA